MQIYRLYILQLSPLLWASKLYIVVFPACGGENNNTISQSPITVNNILFDIIINAIFYLSRVVKGSTHKTYKKI